MVSQTDMQANDSLKLYAVLLVALIVFLSVVILIMSTFTLREMKYKRNLEEIETYYIRYVSKVSIMRCVSSDMITSIFFLRFQILFVKMICKVLKIFQ